MKEIRDTRPKPKPIYRGCPQRFDGSWPGLRGSNRRKKGSKVRIYNLRDELNLPRTDS